MSIAAETQGRTPVNWNPQASKYFESCKEHLAEAT